MGLDYVWEMSIAIQGDCLLIDDKHPENGRSFFLYIPAKWQDKLADSHVLFDILYPATEEEHRSLRGQNDKKKNLFADRAKVIIDLLKNDTQTLAYSLMASIAYKSTWQTNYIDNDIDLYLRAKGTDREDLALHNIVVFLNKKYQKAAIFDIALPYIEYLRNADSTAFADVDAFIDDILKEVCSTKHLSKEIQNAVRAYKQRLRRQQQPKQEKPKPKVKQLEHNTEKNELPNSLGWHQTRSLLANKGNPENLRRQLQTNGYKVNIEIGKDVKGKDSPNSMLLTIQKTGYYLAVRFDDCYSLLTTHYLRAGKILDFIMAQCLKQNAIFKGTKKNAEFRVVKDGFSMPETDVIKYFQYTDAKALEKDFEDISALLVRMSVFVNEKRHKTKQLQETAPFFTLIRLEKGVLTVKLNKEAPWNVFFAFIAPYPAFFFELHADAYNFLSYCLYYARTNAKNLTETLDGLYVDIPLQHVADYMGLPAVKGAMHPYQDTIKRILDAVDEIHRIDGGKKGLVEGLEVETMPNNIVITLPEYVKGKGEGATKPGEWMRGNLRLLIRGDLGISYLDYKTRPIEAEVEAKKRKQNNIDKGVQKAIAETVKPLITIGTNSQTTKTA